MHVFLFAIIFHVNDIIRAFWRLMNHEYAPNANLFLLNLEPLLTYLDSLKYHVLLVTGGFNVRYSTWWSDNIDAIEGMSLESTNNLYHGLYQTLNEPTHILP